MKTGLPLFFISLIILLQACRSGPSAADNKNGLNGKIGISGAFALYPLAVKWAEEFKKLHPGVTFDIQGGGAGKGMTDVLTGTVSLGMVSRDINEVELKNGAYPIAVAKDAVLPVLNANNPFYGDILKKGVTVEQLRDIWISGKVKTWGDLLNNGSKEVIRVYTRSDACGAAETWAKLFNEKQEDLLGVGVFGDPGLADAVAKNKFAVGFNNVSYVFDYTTQKPNENIRVLPIDLNNDGQLSKDEYFYDNVYRVDEAISAGIYPSPPARPLYFVSKEAPKDTLVTSFLKWALTDGQKFVTESGYVKLPDDLLQGEMKKLTK